MYTYTQPTGMSTIPDIITVYNESKSSEYSNNELPSGVSDVKIVKVLHTKQSSYEGHSISVLTDDGTMITGCNESFPNDRANIIIDLIKSKGYALIKFKKLRFPNFGIIMEILNDNRSNERAPKKGEPGYENTAEYGFQLFLDEMDF